MVRKANPDTISSNPNEIVVKYDDVTYTMAVPSGPVGYKHLRIMYEIDKERKNTIVEKRIDDRETITEIREDPETKKFVEVTRDNPTFGKEIDYYLPNPKLEEVTAVAMEKWVEQILPNIILSHEYEKIPWTVLSDLFAASCTNASIDMSNFRGNQ